MGTKKIKGTDKVFERLEMLQNGQFRIRMVDKTDLPFITQVRTSEHVQNNVGVVLFTNEHNQQKWFEKVSGDPTQFYAMFEIREEGRWRSLGYLRITEIDHKNKSMCVGGDIIEEESGKGYGREMYKLILELGFNVWGMHRLWLLVLEKNERARRLYKKMGFVEEGKYRESVYKSGAYENYILMSILDREYKK